MVNKSLNFALTCVIFSPALSGGGPLRTHCLPAQSQQQLRTNIKVPTLKLTVGEESIPENS